MLAVALALTLSSPAFPPGGQIPVRHTCVGANVSPPLRWTAPPPRARSLTLRLDDPDAPGRTFVHWRGASAATFTRALRGHVVASARLIGRFGR